SYPRLPALLPVIFPLNLVPATDFQDERRTATTREANGGFRRTAATLELGDGHPALTTGLGRLSWRLGHTFCEVGGDRLRNWGYFCLFGYLGRKF
ncbi:unnamed protein product, partial [Linum tenue]